MTRLDSAWLASHPLPAPDADTDKNDRGRVFVLGGSVQVPGALRLTGEAVLRAGAGKLQFGTVADAALLLGMLMPEAAVFGLPPDAGGEISAAAADTVIEHATSCDALLIGPGMRGSEACTRLIRTVIEGSPEQLALILDAGAIAAASDCQEALALRTGPLILTPHHGEMTALCGLTVDEIATDPQVVAQRSAAALNGVVVLKAAETVIAAPDGACLLLDGGTPALATGGSGDVLAGIVAGLAARGADPLTAAAWSVWAHGRAGNDLAHELGGTGLLSRELLSRIPALLNRLPVTLHSADS